MITEDKGSNGIMYFADKRRICYAGPSKKIVSERFGIRDLKEIAETDAGRAPYFEMFRIAKKGARLKTLATRLGILAENDK